MPVELLALLPHSPWLIVVGLYFMLHKNSLKLTQICKGQAEMKAEVHGLKEELHAVNLRATERISALEALVAKK